MQELNHDTTGDSEITGWGCRGAVEGVGQLERELQ